MSYREKNRIKNKGKKILSDILTVIASVASLLAVWLGALNIDVYPSAGTAAVILGFVLMMKVYNDRGYMEEWDD